MTVTPRVITAALVAAIVILFPFVLGLAEVLEERDAAMAGFESCLDRVNEAQRQTRECLDQCNSAEEVEP